MHKHIKASFTLVLTVLAACDLAAPPVDSVDFRATGVDTDWGGDTDTDGIPLSMPSGVWSGSDISKDPNMCQVYADAFGPIEFNFDNGEVSGGNCINPGTFVVKGFCAETAMMTIEANFPGCGVDRYACDVTADQIVCTGVIVAQSDQRLLYRRINLGPAF